jgi:tetratricopeptide (TPR) repeat protein
VLFCLYLRKREKNRPRGEAKRRRVRANVVFSNMGLARPPGDETGPTEWRQEEVMLATLRNGMLLALAGAGLMLAQTTALEGDVKGEDGQPLRGALVKIERTDIKGNYKVKTDKKGHYFHAGLPLGTYNITVEVDGKDVDKVSGVRPRLGDPTAVNFDLSAQRAKREAMQKAAETGQVTQEVERGMSAEEKAKFEKAIKERQASLAKNKALNDAFNAGREALTAKNFTGAIEQFQKASEMDPKQHVIWGNLAEAYAGAAAQPNADKDALNAKSFEAYNKAIELKPDDAAYYNNYGLALAKAAKYEDAQAQLNKAAAIDPQNAGKYFYNLGAILVNTGKYAPAEEAFKQAITADPNYADAHYQYGTCLMAKATTTADGKVVPPPGTKEAFEKYLSLRPDGVNAEAAKGMLMAITGTVSTSYENPDAKKNQKKAAPKKK